MDAEGGLHQPLAKSKGVTVRWGLDATQSWRQTCDPSTGSRHRLRNTKRMRGYTSRASWQETTKPNAIKGLGCAEGRAVLGTRQRKIQYKSICAILGEPLDAAPHVRWCEMERLAAAP